MVVDSDSNFAALTAHCHTHLATAVTPADVISIASQYAKAIPEVHRSRLPSSLLPPTIATENDVSRYAVTVAQAQLSFVGAPDAAAILACVSTFFSAASSRLVQIAHLKRAKA